MSDLTAKPTIDEKLMEQQHFLESLVSRLNDSGDPEAALVAQRAVVCIRETRDACVDAAVDQCDCDWQPEVNAHG